MAGKLYAEADKKLRDETDADADRIDRATAAAPTDLAPGSWERIVLLRARYRFGLPLHVEGDKREDPPERTGGGLGVYRGRLALTGIRRLSRADYSSGNQGEDL